MSISLLESFGSGCATRFPRPGYPRLPRRRTTTNRSAVGGVPCELRRPAAPLLPPLCPRAPPAKVLPPLRRTYYSTPPCRSSLISVLPQELAMCIWIGCACVPAVSSASHCRAPAPLHSPGDFRDLGIWRGCFHRFIPLDRSNSLRFFSTTKKRAKNKEESWSNGWKAGTIHFATQPPELSIITASPAVLLLSVPCGATWSPHRIINGLHCQGNFRGGIEIEEGVGRETGRGQSSSFVPVLLLCFGVLPSLDSRRGLPLFPCLACIGRCDWRSLSYSAGRKLFYAGQVCCLSLFCASVCLFVFGGCKSPNPIWLPALRTSAAAAPTAAA
jgi:hypothetical protein